MNEHTHDADAVQNRRMVGWSIIGVAGFAALHSVIWILMRTQDTYWQEVFVGAEGMVASCVLFLALGSHLVRTPDNV